MTGRRYVPRGARSRNSRFVATQTIQRRFANRGAAANDIIAALRALIMARRTRRRIRHYRRELVRRRPRNMRNRRFYGQYRGPGA